MRCFHIRISSGVFLRALDWDPSTANKILYCDACLEGMGFWYPETTHAFYSNPSTLCSLLTLFLFLFLFIMKHYYVFSVPFTKPHIPSTSPTPHPYRHFDWRQLILSTSFNSPLRALPSYNNILKSSVWYQNDHRPPTSCLICHIADSLSRQGFTHAWGVIKQ